MARLAWPEPNICSQKCGSGGAVACAFTVTVSGVTVSCACAAFHATASSRQRIAAIVRLTLCIPHLLERSGHQCSTSEIVCALRAAKRRSRLRQICILSIRSNPAVIRGMGAVADRNPDRSSFRNRDYRKSALDDHCVGVQRILVAGMLVVVIWRAVIELVAQSEFTTNE